MRWEVSPKKGKPTSAKQTVKTKRGEFVLRVWHAPTLDSWMVEVSSTKNKKPAGRGDWRGSLKQVPLESVSVRLCSSRFDFGNALEAAEKALGWLA